VDLESNVKCDWVPSFGIHDDYHGYDVYGDVSDVHDDVSDVHDDVCDDDDVVFLLHCFQLEDFQIKAFVHHCCCLQKTMMQVWVLDLACVFYDVCDAFLDTWRPSMGKIHHRLILVFDAGSRKHVHFLGSIVKQVKKCCTLVQCIMRIIILACILQ